MPTTLTDEQVANLKQQLEGAAKNKQIADMVDAIYNDPALGKEARALIKKKFPDLPIPEYDIEAKVTARLDAEKAEREEAEKKKRDADDDARYKSARKKTAGGAGAEAITGRERLSPAPRSDPQAPPRRVLAL